MSIIGCTIMSMFLTLTLSAVDDREWDLDPDCDHDNDSGFGEDRPRNIVLVSFQK